MAGKGKKPVKAEDLEEAVRQLRARATALNQLAHKISLRPEGQIEAMGLPMVTKSYDPIDNFIRDCKKGLGET